MLYGRRAAILNQCREGGPVDPRISEELQGIEAGIERLEGPKDAFDEIRERLASTVERRTDVLALSAHNLDTVYEIDKIQADYETKILKPPSRKPGGSGANTVFGLAKLGKRAAVAGMIAADEAGIILENSLAQVNVDTELLIKAPADSEFGTGTTLILVQNDGRRLILISPGVNNSWHKELASRQKRKRLLAKIRDSRILHFSSFVGTDEQKLQRSLIKDVDDQVTFSFTPGALYAIQGLDAWLDVMARTNVLVLYKEQLGDLLAESVPNSAQDIKDALERLFRGKASRNLRQPLVVLVKDRLELTRNYVERRYVHIASGKDELQSFTPPIEIKYPFCGVESVDTTGANDALAAGLLFGLLEGYELHECVNCGFVMATLASKRLGPRDGLPTRSELDQELGKIYG
jgi:ribokinase